MRFDLQCVLSAFAVACVYCAVVAAAEAANAHHFIKVGGWV